MQLGIIEKGLALLDLDFTLNFTFSVTKLKSCRQDQHELWGRVDCPHVLSATMLSKSITLTFGPDEKWIPGEAMT